MGGFHFLILNKEVVAMSTYEVLSLMIGFGMLIIAILGTKK